MDTLKVKDHGYTYRILMAFCTFPLAFLAVAFALDEDYALAAVMVLSVYSIAFVFFVRYLRKSEEVYLIVADKYGVTFLKQGKYRWADIVALESFIKVGYQVWGNSGRSRYERSFVRVILSSEKRFQVEVTNCDHTLNEIINKLNRLRRSREVIETDLKQKS